MAATARKRKSAESPDLASARIAEDIARRNAMTQVYVALGYEAAQFSRLRRSGRRTRGSGDYNARFADRETLRERSRWHYENTPVYRGLVDRTTDLVIGRGLKPRCASKEAETKFLEWCGSQDCDHRGMMDFYELQRSMFRDLIVAGDVGAILTEDGTIQIIESERIVAPGGPREDRNMADGVELDDGGRPIRFHIGEWAAGGGTVSRATRAVDAQFFPFLACTDRPEQTRGVPMYTALLNGFDDLDDYNDFTMVAAKIAAMFALVIKTQFPGAAQGLMQTGSRTAGTSGTGATITRPEQSIEAGSVMHLQPGEDISQVQGQHPGTTYQMFTELWLRQLFAGAGIPIEIGMLDNSNANFSVSRMAELQARHATDPKRSSFRVKFLDRVWLRMVSMWVLDGELPDDPDVFKVQWSPPARQMIDPESETAAAVMEIQNNLTSREQWMTEHGRDIGMTDAQRAEEKEREKELGIEPPDSKPAEPTPDDKDDAAPARPERKARPR